MSRWLSPGLVIALLVVGFLWLRARDSRIRAEALSDIQRDSVVSARAQTDSVIAHRDARDRIREAEQARLTDSVETLVARLEAAPAVELPATFHALPDSVQLPIIAVIDTLEHRVASCVLGLRDCLTAVRVANERVTARDSTIQELTTTRDALQQLYETEQDRASPGLFKRAEMSLPFAALAFVVGLVVAR